jgi:hypothetical protein
MVDELIANDSALNRFFDSHDIMGEPKDDE